MCISASTQKWRVFHIELPMVGDATTAPDKAAWKTMSKDWRRLDGVLEKSTSLLKMGEKAAVAHFFLTLWKKQVVFLKKNPSFNPSGVTSLALFG